MVMAQLWPGLALAALRMSHCAFTEEGQLELHTYFGRCNLCLLFPCVLALSLFNRDMANMKSFLSLLLLGLVGLVQALSSTGNRLLVVLEEASDKSKYSSFFGDLECELCLDISIARTRTD
jgi:hypothetical protein